MLGVTRQMMMPPRQWTAALPPPRVRVYIDNQAAIAMLSKQSRGRNRHMDIRLKFLQLHADIKTFDFLYIPTNDNDADLNTKVLSAPVFRALSRRVMGEDTQTDGMALVKDAIRALHARTPPRGDVPQGDARIREHGGVSEHHLSPDCVAHVDALIEGVARDMAEQAAARLQPVRSESRRFRTVDVARAYTHSPIRRDFEYAPSPTTTRPYGKY